VDKTTEEFLDLVEEKLGEDFSETQSKIVRRYAVAVGHPSTFKRFESNNGS
jgi:hypothetical protein